MKTKRDSSLERPLECQMPSGPDASEQLRLVMNQWNTSFTFIEGTLNYSPIIVKNKFPGGERLPNFISISKIGTF